MQKNKHRRYLTTFGFIDLLFNMLVGFVFLFFIAYILINPIADDGKVDPPDQALIVINWSNESDFDVDVWVRDPNGKILSFTNKTIKGMHLEKDDLGKTGDAPGYVKNQEVVHITQFFPGSYEVSVHLYSMHDQVEPDDITVEFMTIKNFRKYGSRTVTLKFKGQEEPIVRIKAGEKNKVLDVDWDFNGAVVEWNKVNSVQLGEGNIVNGNEASR